VITPVRLQQASLYGHDAVIHDDGTNYAGAYDAGTHDAGAYDLDTYGAAACALSAFDLTDGGEAELRWYSSSDRIGGSR
jgi:hypothetical protein